MVQYFLLRESTGMFILNNLFRLIHETIIARIVYAILLVLGYSSASIAHNVSPKQFGLDSASSGKEVYEVLYRTHCYALEHGADVSYRGIDKINIEIPGKANSIPLTSKTNFAGCTFYVSNKVKDNFPLFEMDGEKEERGINYTGYGDVKPPSYGFYMLQITDSEPWVSNRKGYNYGATRRDIMLVDKGRVKDEPIAPYTTSNYEAKLIKVQRKKKTISNINFIRTDESTKKTLLFRISNAYNIKLTNISVHTPENEILYGDAIIEILNCYSVVIKRVNVDATYSFKDKYGYAISLNNVAHFKGDKIVANGNWGVFCCNNIRDIELDDCTINRFDTHCYGRDYLFKDCTFTSIGLPMSSVYGKLRFKNCVFDHAIPILYRADYNAYTPFDACFDGCTFLFPNRQNCIVDLAEVPRETNNRKELEEKCIPNLKIINCSFILDSNVSCVSLFNGIYDSNRIFGHIKSVVVKNSTISDIEAKFQIFCTKPLSKYEIEITTNL